VARGERSVLITCPRLPFLSLLLHCTALEYLELSQALGKYHMASLGGNSTTTQLLTLLNTSATKPKRPDTVAPFLPGKKLNARKKVTIEDSGLASNDVNIPLEDVEEGSTRDFSEEEEEPEVASEEADADAGQSSQSQLHCSHPHPVSNTVSGDPYEENFGPSPASLTDSRRSAVDSSSWQKSSERLPRLGNMSLSLPEDGPEPSSSKHRPAVCIPY
jgi:hypothetical protein